AALPPDPVEGAHVLAGRDARGRRDRGPRPRGAARGVGGGRLGGTARGLARAARRGPGGARARGGLPRRGLVGVHVRVAVVRSLPAFGVRLRLPRDAGSAVAGRPDVAAGPSAPALLLSARARDRGGRPLVLPAAPLRRTRRPPGARRLRGGQRD